MYIEFCARGEKTNQRKETDEKTPDLTLRFRRFSLKKIYFPSVAKYSFTIFTTVPDNRNTAIRFGIAINPLKVSAILHRSPSSTVAPRIATREYTTINGFTTFSLENRNSIHLAPYSPHPMIVEKAKQHIATAVKTDIQLPYTEVNPDIVSSAPAACP